MISKRDVQLGKIALKENMVSKEQINKCLKIKKKLNTKASLGAILVKKGYINKDELERIVKIHNEARNGASESGISSVSDSGPDAKSEAKKDRSQRRSKRRKTIEKTGDKVIADEAPSERRSKRKKAREEEASGSKDGKADEASEKSDTSSDEDKKSRRSKRSKRETRRSSRKADLAEAEDKDAAKEEAKKEARSGRRSARRSKRSKTLAKASGAVQIAEAEPEEAASKTSDVKTADEKDSSKDKKSADKKDDKKSKRSKRSKRSKTLAKSSTKASGIDLDELMGEEAAKDGDKKDEDKKSRRSKRSKREKKRGSNRVAVEENGSADTNGTVLSSASVFESADDLMESQEFDDEGRIQKKIVACSNCGKKYRVKPRQAGKRFGCRRCATKVRVPKDYFEQDEIVGFGPRGKRKGKRSKKSRRSATAVEEFNIDDVESDDGSEENSEAAEQAVAATKTKTQDKDKGKKKAVASYAALTKEAMKAPQTIRRDERMSKKALLQMAGLALLLFGGIGLFFYIQHLDAAAEEEARQAAIDTEWDSFKTRIEESAAKAKAVLGKTLKPGELDSVEEAYSFLGGAIKSKTELRYPNNRKRAAALIGQELGLEKLRFQLLASKARVQASQRNFRGVEDAVRSLKEAIELEEVDGQAFIDLGRYLALTRNWAQALEVTGKAKDKGADFAAQSLSFKGRIYETLAAAKEAADLYERLVAAGTPAGAMLQARAALSARAVNDARKLLVDLEGQDVLGDAPRLRAALKILLGRCDERENQLDKAEANYLQAQTTADDLAWGWLALGELQLRRGQYEKAVGSFTTASEKKGGARALIGLARAQFGLLQSEEALATLRRAVTLTEAPDAEGPMVAGQPVLINPQEAELPSSEAYRWLGDLYRALERPSAAVAAYQKSLSLDPWNIRAHARYAALEVELDKLDEAGNRLKLALRLIRGLQGQRQVVFDGRPRLATEDSGELFLAIAFHAQKSGDSSRAAEALPLARQLLPGSARSFAATGQLLQLRDRPRGARREFDASLKIEREHPAYKKGLLDFQSYLSSQDKGALERVLGGAAAALTENPNHASALCLRGRAQLASGRVKEGLAALKHAIELNPYFITPLIYRGFHNAGLLGGDRTDFESAKRDFEASLKIDAKDKRALYGYGLAKLKLGDSNAALASANAALEVDGEFREAYLLRAEVYLSIGKKEQADADRKRAQTAQARLGF